MKGVQLLLFPLVFISCLATEYCPKVCLLNDVQCVTQGNLNLFKTVVKGQDSCKKAMDPLSIREIDGQKESTKYIVTKIEVKGLYDCAVTNVTVNVPSQDYWHHTNCPKLSLTFNYKIMDQSHSQHRDVNVTVTACNYNILTLGRYGVFVSAKDNMPHFYIQSYSPSIEHEGELEYDMTPSCDRDKRDYRKEVVEYLFFLVFKKAIATVFAGMDSYCKTALMGEVLPGCNEEL